MGEVYKAEDIKLKRMTALKFLSLNSNMNREAKERFIKEARTASALDHPNICTLYEINETPDSQIPYLALGLLVLFLSAYFIW